MPFFSNAANTSKGPSFERVELPRSHLNVQYNTVLQEVTHDGVARKVSMLTLSLADVSAYKPRPPAPQPGVASSKPVDVFSPKEAGLTVAAAAEVSIVSEPLYPSDAPIAHGTSPGIEGHAVSIQHRKFRCHDSSFGDKQADKSVHTEHDIPVQGPEDGCSDTDGNGKPFEEAVEDFRFVASKIGTSIKGYNEVMKSEKEVN